MLGARPSGAPSLVANDQRPCQRDPPLVNASSFAVGGKREQIVGYLSR
jgi:hypothetical protein